MATPTTQTELLKSQAYELVKQYIVYDAQERPIEVYTAITELEAGGACTLTQYEYLSPTSSQIVKRKESYAVWQAAWDI